MADVDADAYYGEDSANEEIDLSFIDENKSSD